MRGLKGTVTKPWVSNSVRCCFSGACSGAAERYLQHAAVQASPNFKPSLYIQTWFRFRLLQLQLFNPQHSTAIPRNTALLAIPLYRLSQSSFQVKHSAIVRFPTAITPANPSKPGPNCFSFILYICLEPWSNHQLLNRALKPTWLTRLRHPEIRRRESELISEPWQKVACPKDAMINASLFTPIHFCMYCLVM